MTSQLDGAFAAFDLGAASARLLVGRVDGDRLVMSEAMRVENLPIRLPDGLHWDLLGMHARLTRALAATSRDQAIASVGIDGWGVDYGLLDGDGRLLGLPYHYRDARSSAGAAGVKALIGGRELYEATGIQQMPINTVNQLYAEKGSIAYADAESLLLLPDLIAFFLTGVRAIEETNASTTQLFDARTAAPAEQVFERLALRRGLLPQVAKPGTVLGGVLDEVARSVSLEGCPRVVAVGSHDTASAVVAVPADQGEVAYVVSGTWTLVGFELERPVINDTSFAKNFSNERGIEGTVRFLRNVMGHWMLQECVRNWNARGRGLDLRSLIDEAARRPAFESLVDVDDALFAAPADDMAERVRARCRQTGEAEPTDEVAVVRCIIDSMGLGIARALDDAEVCSGHRAQFVHVVGGGAANAPLLDVVAASVGRSVLAGPVEASSIGNVLVQMGAAGIVADRWHMRDFVRKSFEVKRVDPEPGLERGAARARARFETLSKGAAT